MDNKYSCFMYADKIQISIYSIPNRRLQKKNKSKNASLLWGRAWPMQCNAAGMTDGSSTRAKNVLRTTYVIRDAGDRCPHSHLMKRLPSTPYILVSKEINIPPYTDLPSENGPDREQPPFSFSLIGDLHSPPY